MFYSGFRACFLTRSPSDRSVTALARRTASPAPSLVRAHLTERRRHNPAIGSPPWPSWFRSVSAAASPLRASRQKPRQALAVRRRLARSQPDSSAPSSRWARVLWSGKLHKPRNYAQWPLATVRASAPHNWAYAKCPPAQEQLIPRPPCGSGYSGSRCAAPFPLTCPAPIRPLGLPQNRLSVLGLPLPQRRHDAPDCRPVGLVQQ